MLATQRIYGDDRDLIADDMDEVLDAHLELSRDFVAACQGYIDIIGRYDPNSEGEKVAAVQKRAAWAITYLMKEKVYVYLDIDPESSKQKLEELFGEGSDVATLIYDGLRMEGHLYGPRVSEIQDASFQAAPSDLDEWGWNDTGAVMRRVFRFPRDGRPIDVICGEADKQVATAVESLTPYLWYAFQDWPVYVENMGSIRPDKWQEHHLICVGNAGINPTIQGLVEGGVLPEIPEWIHANSEEMRGLYYLGADSPWTKDARVAVIGGTDPGAIASAAALLTNIEYCHAVAQHRQNDVHLVEFGVNSGSDPVRAEDMQLKLTFDRPYIT